MRQKSTAILAALGAALLYAVSIPLSSFLLRKTGPVMLAALLFCGALPARAQSKNDYIPPESENKPYRLAYYTDAQWVEFEGDSLPMYTLRRITVFAPLKFKNKKAAAFGCYGWSGEGVAVLQKELKEAGFDVVDENVKSLWNPGEEDFAKVPELVKALLA